MGGMFYEARSFDQDLSTWDISGVETFRLTDYRGDSGFLENAGLSSTNYDALLNGWAALDLQDDLTLDAQGIQYTPDAAAARQSIIDTYGWTIDDGGPTEPLVLLTDGTSYSPPAPVSDTERNPVGQITLTATTGASVTALTLTAEGANRGVRRLSLWASPEETFSAEAAVQKTEQILDSSSAMPATIAFDGFSQADGTYLYVVADLAADAAGDVQFSLASASDLTVTGGTVANSSSDFPMLLSGSSQPLPVELTDFDAQASGEAVSLTWQTASETNNTGFEVQRRSDGPWEALTFVEGAGTTAEPHAYRFRDAALPFADSLVYRLKQVDTDGTSAFSPEVVVRRGPGSDVQLAAPFPNPVRQQATVRYVVPEGSAQPVRLAVYNVLGQRVATLVDETQPPGREELSLDASRWASGVYFLRLQVGETMRSQRVTVVR
jgi:hypothetical protein